MRIKESSNSMSYFKNEISTITFQCKYNTSFGQSLRIVGNIEIGGKHRHINRVIETSAVVGNRFAWTMVVPWIGESGKKVQRIRHTKRD